MDAYELSHQPSLKDEFAALEAEDSVNAELAALKKKVQAKKKTKTEQ